MPRLFNVDHQAAVLSHDRPGVPPGAAHNFTDDELEAGIAGLWSETDPRKGLPAERAFKRKRDSKAAKATTPPAEPDDTKE